MHRRKYIACTCMYMYMNTQAHHNIQFFYIHMYVRTYGIIMCVLYSGTIKLGPRIVADYSFVLFSGGKCLIFLTLNPSNSICDRGSGKIQHFADSIKMKILLYLASIMSELQVYMSIYNCMPLILPILRVVKLPCSYSQL